MTGNNVMSRDDFAPDYQGLAKIFIESLKAITEDGDKPTVMALSEKLSSNIELANYFPVTGSVTTENSAPVAADEDVSGSEGETAEKNTGNEHTWNKQRQVYKESSLTLLSMLRTDDNRALFDIMDEYKTLISEDAKAEQILDKLRALRDRLFKHEIGGDQPQPDDGSMFQKIFRRADNSLAVESLKRLRQVLVEVINELQILLGGNYRANLVMMRKSIESEEDFDSIISHHRSIIKMIEEYIEEAQKEKEEITAFLRDIAERLSNLESQLYSSNEKTIEHINAEYTFSDNLQHEMQTVTEVMQNITDVDALKKNLLSKLDNITSELSMRKTEYESQIEYSKQQRLKIRDNFKDVINSVHKKNLILEEQSRTDPLTGVYNRRVLEERLDDELTRLKRYDTSFSVIFFDIDNFKSVNDDFGHEAGDRALKGLTKKVHDNLRKTDVFARFGGDEFMIVLTATTLKNAVHVAEKIHAAAANTEFSYEGRRVPVTLSMGVTEARKTDTEITGILKRVDALMYRAKKAGRNQIKSDLDR